MLDTLKKMWMVLRNKDGARDVLSSEMARMAIVRSLQGFIEKMTEGRFSVKESERLYESTYQEALRDETEEQARLGFDAYEEKMHRFLPEQVALKRAADTVQQYALRASVPSGLWKLYSKVVARSYYGNFAMFERFSGSLRRLRSGEFDVQTAKWQEADS